MSTTCADLIAETQSYLYSTSRDPLNKLSGSINSSVTSLSLTYELGAARKGSILSVDLELMYIWDVTSEQNNTVTVQRGYANTTAATHADGALVTVDPKFSNFAVFNALNADLDDLSANGLFRVETDVVTYSSAIQGYALSPTSTIIELLQVKYDEAGPAKLWPEIKSYKLRRASDTSDFSSGDAIVVYDAGQDGSDIRVTYAAPFVHFSAVGDTIASTGLAVTANDLPPLGATLRLQSMREGQRNFNEAQPATRRASEVPPGAQLQGARGPSQIRRDRIRVEASRLRKAWPSKKRLPA